MTQTTQWGSHYNERDIQIATHITNSINSYNLSQAELARRSNISGTTLSQILSGKYPSSPTEKLESANSVIKTIAARAMVREQPIVETTVYRMVMVACRSALVSKTFSVVCANCGTGKTTALKSFVEQNPHIYMVEVLPGMTQSVMLSELVRQTGAMVTGARPSSPGTISARTDAIIQTLKNRECLIIIDEANRAQPALLEAARRIGDISRCGIVFAGTKYLKHLVASPDGQFGELHSRVGMWPPLVERITRSDIELIVQAALGDEFELSEDIFDTFEKSCRGSARMLAQALIPNLRKFVLNRGGKLTSKSIYEVTNKLLGFDVEAQ